MRLLSCRKKGRCREKKKICCCIFLRVFSGSVCFAILSLFLVICSARLFFFGRSREKWLRRVNGG